MHREAILALKGARSGSLDPRLHFPRLVSKHRSYFGSSEPILDPNSLRRDHPLPYSPASRGFDSTASPRSSFVASNMIIEALWSENHGKSERLAVELLGTPVAVSTGSHIQIVVAHIGFR
jgi:hypothetical protein